MDIKPIGATALLRWNDSPEHLTFEDYISFGQYDEDEETDGLGVDDLYIFAYVDDLETLKSYTSPNRDFDWTVVELIQVHYE